MPKIPGVNRLKPVAVLEKAGFRIIRQGIHIVMSDGTRTLTIPRHNPVIAFTLGGIVRDAGLSVEEFRKLLYGKTREGMACFLSCRVAAPRGRGDLIALASLYSISGFAIVKNPAPSPDSSGSPGRVPA